MGASMGALQAYDWAARYPEMVGRIIPVIGSAEANPWADRLDGRLGFADPPRSEVERRRLLRQGAAAGGPRAVAQAGDAARAALGLGAASFGRSFAEGGKDPLAAHANRYRVETFLNNAGMARARVSDANHFLYLARANQTFAPGGAQTLDEAAKKIKAPTLLLYAPGDQVFPAAWIKRRRTR